MKQTQLCYPTPSNLPPPPRASFKTSAALPDAAPRIYALRDGELVLYKRKRSRVWQYRYKLFTGQWVRVSTGKTVLEHAVRVAADSYDEARYRERLGLAPVQKSFADIARVTLEELRRDLAAGTGKKSSSTTSASSSATSYPSPVSGTCRTSVTSTLPSLNAGATTRWAEHPKAAH